MAGLNIELPTFGAEDLTDAKARQRIISYLYRLAEQVKYFSTHIDGENVTEAFAAEIASTASAQAKDELSGTLTEYETKIEQNARQIETKASQTTVDALGNEVETVSSSLTQTASSLTAKITKAQNTATNAKSTAEDAEETVASLSLSLEGVVASIEGNRLAFTANGLSIKNAAGETVFVQDNTTGNLTITGTINADGGTIGGFTIGEDSITGPNGIKLSSTENYSTVNNIRLRSGTDAFGRKYTLISPDTDTGYQELRFGMYSNLALDGMKLYVNSSNEMVAQVDYRLLISGGADFYNLPQVSGVESNLYIDASGKLYRIV